MPVYALTIFSGAFLLFLVQPLIGKYILPWFGGGPGVWTTCMLFFQLLLLCGYAYAHLMTRCLKARWQAVVHLALLAAALALLPITPADFWKPRGSENPTWQILGLLTASLGLPYFVLSTTGPLLQQWFSRSHPGVSPYRLYALSNAGSLLALVSFPFYFESHFTRKAQAALWGWGLGGFAVCSALCAVKLYHSATSSTERRRSQDENQNEGEQEPLTSSADPSSAIHHPPSTDRDRHSIYQSPFTLLLWLLLPACASVLLLATTNKLCQDVAVIPFLWVLPLGLYLLSFIIAFDSPRWYVRLPFTLALIAAAAGICWALFKGSDASLYQQVGLYCAGLFFCCMVCHGELYRLKPEPQNLTGFYLMIAAGGALGGVLVAVVAPVVFTDFYELHWGLLLCGLLFVLVCARDQNPISLSHWRWLACALTLAAFAGLDWALAWLSHGHYKAVPKGVFAVLRMGLWSALLLLAGSWIARGQFKVFRHWRMVACLWLALGVAVLGAVLWMQGHPSSETVWRSRNFYGVLKVHEYRRNEPDGHHFLLEHGRITHGLQFVEPKRSVWPTTYYAENSGIGLAVGALPAVPRRFGVVGLGTGTMKAYSRAGDYVRFYEINPQVKQLATSRFTYLAQCPGQVEVALGDARLSLEREPAQNFDLLVLDAFSSDAIPVHLLTQEAFEIYQRHLNTNGIIAVHISNHYLDLEPVVVNLAHRFNYKLAEIDFDEEDQDEWWIYSSTWILLTHNQQIIASPGIRAAASEIGSRWTKVPLWTDDFASLFQILKR